MLVDRPSCQQDFKSRANCAGRALGRQFFTLFNGLAANAAVRRPNITVFRSRQTRQQGQRSTSESAVGDETSTPCSRESDRRHGDRPILIGASLISLGDTIRHGDERPVA